MTETTDIDMAMDANNLYREEVYTDRKMGSLRVMQPVTSEGEVDEQRAVLYVGHAQLMTPMGALPLVFDIEATSLPEALSKYPVEAKAALDRTMEELQELRRQQASQIVTADNLGGLGGMPGGPGGKIQIP